MSPADGSGAPPSASSASPSAPFSLAQPPTNGETPRIAMKGFSLTSRSVSAAGTANSSHSSNKPTNGTKKPASALGKRPRSAFAPRGSSSSSNNNNNNGVSGLGSDDENDDDDDDYGDDGGGRRIGGRGHGRVEAVTGFDSGRAVGMEGENRSNERQALVIPKMGNRDWRGAARQKQQRRTGGGRNLLPPEVQAQRAAAAAAAVAGSPRNGEGPGARNGVLKNEGVDVVNAKGSEPRWGLTITSRREGDGGVTSELVAAAEGEEEGAPRDVAGRVAAAAVATTAVAVAVNEPPREKTDDELALEALTGAQSARRGPDLVIPVASASASAAAGGEVEELDDEGERPRDRRPGNGGPPPASEEDAYRRAIRAAPEASTLEDYERVPVEEFGAALLRGMGWREGEPGAGAGGRRGRVERPKEAKRRQNLLGLGASQLKDAEELGAWVQKSDPKRLVAAGGGGGGGQGLGKRGGGVGERRPKASDYRREKERREERREERYGDGYKRERERGEYREKDRYRDEYRDRRR